MKFSLIIPAYSDTKIIESNTYFKQGSYSMEISSNFSMKSTLGYAKVQKQYQPFDMNSYNFLTLWFYNPYSNLKIASFGFMAFGDDGDNWKNHIECGENLKPGWNKIKIDLKKCVIRGLPDMSAITQVSVNIFADRGYRTFYIDDLRLIK
ncbi:hypothetical protein L6303_03965 [archaeon]|nr:hypothetical protein [Nanoarchaeota archaeon]MCG2723876.1 hypothetical protein [archaeon]